MRFALSLTVTFALIAHSSVAAEGKHIPKKGYYGCTTESDFNKVMGYISDGDREAYVKFMSAALALGVCTTFDTGEEIFVVERKLAVVKVRRKGSMNEYWTFVEAAR